MKNNLLIGSEYNKYGIVGDLNYFSDNFNVKNYFLIEICV
jgi:hypothetical protein